jgi:peptidoglycan hydrolase CwlO-like protein
MILLSTSRKEQLAALLKSMVVRIKDLEKDNREKQAQINSLQKQIDILSNQVSELAFMVEGAENVHKISKNPPLTMVAGGY